VTDNNTLNYVYISPHFPPNFYLFAVNLAKHGVNVLGITDMNDSDINPALKHAMKAHYRVNSLSDINELKNACHYFTHHFGKIDFVESHLESWLENEAKLRTEFNVEGIKINDIPNFIRKSRMKKIFQNADITTSAGILIKNSQDLLDFVYENKFPVIVKPDIGVGAGDTYKISNDEELNRFINSHDIHNRDFFAEKFIEGTIETFDGLADKDGNILFCTSLVYSGTLEMKEGAKFYYLRKEMPSDLELVGKKTVKAFNIKAKFFHIEFFRDFNNNLFGLEINVRPPGGFTTDMINFSADADIYNEYANMIKNNSFDTDFKVKYYTGFFAREDWKTYIYTYDEIFEKYWKNIVFSGRIPDVFAPLMGNQGFIVRAETYEKITEIFKYLDKSV